MKRSDGRVSSLDTLIRTETGGRGPVRKPVRTKKKYLLLLLLVPLLLALFYFLSRGSRDAGDRSITTAPHDNDDHAGVRADIIRKKNSMVKKFHKAGPADRKTPVVVIEHRDDPGRGKGPVNFGTSLEIVAPK